MKDVKSKYDQLVLKYLKIYNEALQSMVEGQREVVNNDDHMFDDGTSVKERKEEFEKWLKSMIPRYLVGLRFSDIQKTDAEKLKTGHDNADENGNGHDGKNTMKGRTAQLHNDI